MPNAIPGAAAAAAAASRRRSATTSRASCRDLLPALPRIRNPRLLSRAPRPPSACACLDRPLLLRERRLDISCSNASSSLTLAAITSSAVGAFSSSKPKSCPLLLSTAPLFLSSITKSTRNSSGGSLNFTARHSAPPIPVLPSRPAPCSSCSTRLPPVEPDLETRAAADPLGQRPTPHRSTSTSHLGPHRVPAPREPPQTA